MKTPKTLNFTLSKLFRGVGAAVLALSLCAGMGSRAVASDPLLICPTTDNLVLQIGADLLLANTGQYIGGHDDVAIGAMEGGAVEVTVRFAKSNMVLSISPDGDDTFERTPGSDGTNTFEMVPGVEYHLEFETVQSVGPVEEWNWIWPTNLPSDGALTKNQAILKPQDTCPAG